MKQDIITQQWHLLNHMQNVIICTLFQTYILASNLSLDFYRSFLMYNQQCYCLLKYVYKMYQYMCTDMFTCT